MREPGVASSFVSSDEPVTIGRYWIPIGSRQQMRFVEIPAGWRIESSKLKTPSAKQILQAWILIAQHYCVDGLLIASEQRAKDTQPLLDWNFRIDIEYVKCLDLIAKSSSSLIHRHQHFLIRPMAANCKRGDCVIPAGEIAPTNVGRITEGSQLSAATVNRKIIDLLGGCKLPQRGAVFKLNF